jgi:hypothetical protein
VAEAEAETSTVAIEPEPPPTSPIMIETLGAEPKRQNAFGATSSFAQSKRSGAKPAEPPKQTATPVLPGLAALIEPAAVQPIRQPVPPPVVKPVTAPPAPQERILEPAGAGPDIYKPWS